MKISKTDKPQAIKHIQETVSNLIKPDLGLLYQMFIDQKAGLRKEHNALLKDRNRIRHEGYGAAIRLMALSAEPSTPRLRHATSKYLGFLKSKSQTDTGGQDG